MNPDDIKNKNTVENAFPIGIKKMWNPHYRFPDGMKKNDFQSHTDLDPHLVLPSANKKLYPQQEPSTLPPINCRQVNTCNLNSL